MQNSHERKKTVRVSERTEKVLHAAALLRGGQIADLIEDYADWLLSQRFNRVAFSEEPLVPTPKGGDTRGRKAQVVKPKRKAHQMSWKCPISGKTIRKKDDVLPHFVQSAKSKGLSRKDALKIALSEGWLVKVTGAIFFARGSADRRKHLDGALRSYGLQ